MNLRSNKIIVTAVIFDINGTLVDSVDLHAEAWQAALERQENLFRRGSSANRQGPRSIDARFLVAKGVGEVRRGIRAVPQRPF